MSQVAANFRMLLDPEAMRALFAARLPAFSDGNVAITECEIQHPRYKTYLNPQSRDKAWIALAYHLRTDGAESDRAILYAKAFLGSRGRDEYELARERMGAARDRLWYFEDLGLFGWTFPDDPALPQLPALLDRSVMTERLAGLTGGSPAPIVRVDIINYRPELRCTLRYRLDGEAGAATIYAKTFADQRGAEISRRITTIGAATTSASDFVIAPVLAHEADSDTLWFLGLQGTPALNELTDAKAESLMRKLAVALAGLHRRQLDGLEPVDVDQQWLDLKKKAAKLSLGLPRASADVMNLLGELERSRPHAGVPSVLLHGDFHIQQLLCLADGRLALFDFDELAFGDPLQDLANFAADLYGQALGDPRVDTWIEALLDGYRGAAPNPFDPARFDWHFKAQLLTRAYRAFIQQKPDLQHRLRQLLQFAQSRQDATQAPLAQTKFRDA